jgi:Zn-dependent M28 family amino/carboxypeptidase
VRQGSEKWLYTPTTSKCRDTEKPVSRSLTTFNRAGAYRYSIAVVTTHTPLNSIIFAWFDGEEEGMVGSTEFVRRSPVPLDRIAANVNLDMVSHNWKGELFAAGARRYPVMRPLLDSVKTLELITLKQRHDGDIPTDNWTYRSDQAPFHARGVPLHPFWQRGTRRLPRAE